MAVTELERRFKKLTANLDEFEQLAISQLNETHPEASEAERANWSHVFKEWKAKMGTVFNDSRYTIERDRNWRRLVFLLVKARHEVPRYPILDDSKNSVSYSISTHTFKYAVTSTGHKDIPSWVDDCQDVDTITVIFHRLLALDGYLEHAWESMILRTRWREKPFGYEAYREWKRGVESAVPLHAGRDSEWEKILFMIDDMVKRFKEGENLVDRSGNIKSFFTGEGMVRSLAEPVLRFKDFHPKNRSADHLHLERSLNKGNGTSATSLSRRQQLRYGQATAGGGRRLSI
ncbi:hypothetical protein JCM5353_006311 [Sporobolomyces roseus]